MLLWLLLALADGTGCSGQAQSDIALGQGFFLRPKGVRVPDYYPPSDLIYSNRSELKTIWQSITPGRGDVVTIAHAAGFLANLPCGDTSNAVRLIVATTAGKKHCVVFKARNSAVILAPYSLEKLGHGFVVHWKGKVDGRQILGQATNTLDKLLGSFAPTPGPTCQDPLNGFLQLEELTIDL